MRILSDNAAKAAVRETRRLGKKRAPARRGNSMSVMAAECVAEPVPAPPKAAARSASLSGPTTPSPKTKKKAPVPTIEVAPGVNLILRGAKETREAIQSDFFVPVQCFSCGTDDVLFAIADADYFVCPCCQGKPTLRSVI